MFRRAGNTSRARNLAIRFLIALAIAGGVSGGEVCHAGKSSVEEVKAAFLYNFARFIEWPDAVFNAPQSPFVIGVLGEDPFGGALGEIVGHEKGGGRRIEIRRWGQAHEVAGCHLLFVNPDLPDRLTVLRSLPAEGLLTVGDGEGFVESGGIIGLIVEQNRVRFEVNLAGAERAGLVLSSKLLNLAREVGHWPVEGDLR